MSVYLFWRSRQTIEAPSEDGTRQKKCLRHADLSTIDDDDILLFEQEVHSIQNKLYLWYPRGCCCYCCNAMVVVFFFTGRLAAMINRPWLRFLSIACEHERKRAMLFQIVCHHLEEILEWAEAKPSESVNVMEHMDLWSNWIVFGFMCGQTAMACSGNLWYRIYSSFSLFWEAAFPHNFTFCTQAFLFIFHPRADVYDADFVGIGTSTFKGLVELFICETKSKVHHWNHASIGGKSESRRGRGKTLLKQTMQLLSSAISLCERRYRDSLKCHRYIQNVQNASRRKKSPFLDTVVRSKAKKLHH